MLTQINHWMEYAAAFDLILLLRILTLRLQRTYVFLTLACALAVLFDIATLFYAPDSKGLPLYAELFSALVFPLAAWDIFEEIAGPVGALRRLAIVRTITSLVVICVFGLFWTSALVEGDDPQNLGEISLLSFVVATGSAASCLAFLWIMRRGIGLQKIAVPRNTSVWMIFFALSMVSQLAAWFISVVGREIGKPIQDGFLSIGDFLLGLFGILITLWCAVKLRGLPKDIPSASLNENS